jgi:hypothetical protein
MTIRKISPRRVLVLAAALVLVASAASAYVLLSPARTWDSPPNYIVDNRGLTGVNDGDGGASRTRNAIVSSSAWNGSSAGTVVKNLSIGEKPNDTISRATKQRRREAEKREEKKCPERS